MAHVILCEKQKERRAALTERFADTPFVTILRTHEQLMDHDFSRYAWLFVMNDPCGPSNHGVAVLEHLARHPRADFLILVNEGAIKRHAGLRLVGTGSEPLRIQRARQSRHRYVWMLDPEQWRQHLDRQHVCWYRTTINNHAFHGRVLVVSNYLAAPLQRQSWRTAQGCTL